MDGLIDMYRPAIRSDQKDQFVICRRNVDLEPSSPVFEIEDLNDADTLDILPYPYEHMD